MQNFMQCKWKKITRLPISKISCNSVWVISCLYYIYGRISRQNNVFQRQIWVNSCDKLHNNSCIHLLKFDVSYWDNFVITWRYKFTLLFLVEVMTVRWQFNEIQITNYISLTRIFHKIQWIILSNLQWISLSRKFTVIQVLIWLVNLWNSVDIDSMSFILHL